MDKSDRERFEALLAAKKNKGGTKTPGHEQDHRTTQHQNPKATKAWRRKV